MQKKWFGIGIELIKKFENMRPQWVWNCKDFCNCGGVLCRQWKWNDLTLGGGNHFIEVDKSSDGTYFLVIHSSSRNLGKQVAEIYQNLAVDLHKGKEDYFRQKDYLHDVEICQQFVKRNRAEMGAKIQKQGKVFRNGNNIWFLNYCVL